MFHFEPKSHVYTVDGEVLPSVTDILRPLSDEFYGGIPLATLAAAAERGRRADLACQLIDEDDLDDASVEDDIAPRVIAYRKFLAETGAVAFETARSRYHPEHRYAGTLDVVLRFPHRGVLALVDRKCVATIIATVYPQLAAYDELRRREQQQNPEILPCDELGVLQLRDDGTYRYLVARAGDIPMHRAVFHAYRTILQWRNRYAR
jgi:hypothetical protein